MGSGFAKKKKQARMLQEQFSKFQDTLADTTATGTAGNGLVTITLNGNNEMVEVKIKPECVDPDDIEGLEDLFKAAYNDAQEKLKENTPEGIPGMPNLGGLELGNLGF